MLSRNHFALLIGMVLDQQFPLERAFAAPALLADRVGAEPEPALIAGMDPEELSEAFRGPPALHRFPGSMAARVQEMARLVTEQYGAEASRIWHDSATGEELLGRVQALPGFGARKAKIFVALLGKQLGVDVPGWREASAPFGEPGSLLSVADITSPETLVAVREHKRQLKLAARAAGG